MLGFFQAVTFFITILGTNESAIAHKLSHGLVELVDGFKWFTHDSDAELRLRLFEEQRIPRNEQDRLGWAMFPNGPNHVGAITAGHFEIAYHDVKWTFISVPLQSIEAIIRDNDCAVIENIDHKITQ